MEDRKFEIIEQLMEELQSMMQPGPDDFSERLGREKPKPEVAIELEMEGAPMEEIEESPEDKLKSRLMKMRG